MVLCRVFNYPKFKNHKKISAEDEIAQTVNNKSKKGKPKLISRPSTKVSGTTDTKLVDNTGGGIKTDP